MFSILLLLSLALVPCRTAEPRATWAEPARDTNAAGAPSVVVIVLDDISALDLPGLPLPSLSALASKGVLFERAYGQPVCHPARRTMLSGEVWPLRAGSIPCEPNPGTPPQVGDLPLPALFDAAGYQTAGFGKWHLGLNPTGAPWPTAPSAHGFEHWFAGIPANVELCGGRNYRTWLRMEEGRAFLFSGYHTQELVTSFLNWWPIVRGPKMAWVAFQAAHEPFHRPPDSFLPPGYPPTNDERAQFEAMIVSADTGVGELLAAIDLAHTYVILVADNGTPEKVAPDPLKAKQTTFEHGVHVPMIIAGPGVTPGHSSAVVSIVDVFETLRELCALDRTRPVRDSVSLVPCLSDASFRPRRYAYAQLEDDLAVISQRFKLREKAGVQSFYDLRLDPDEERPIALDDPTYARVIALHQRWLEASRR